MTLYQIQTKYRDEARPRAGILRGREFVMKDSYSFDLDDDGLKRSYEQHREAYIRTFDRLGLTYKICFATSGAMGGSASEEFLAPAATGEDTFVACHHCGYAANAEAVTTPAPAAPGASTRPCGCWTPRTPRPSSRWWPTSTSTTAWTSPPPTRSRTSWSRSPRPVRTRPRS
nr:hypothetical protein GCM10020093_103410 [Planobispora longispora]